MLEIKGKEYNIKYTINTLCVMANEGMDVTDLGNMKMNIVTIRDLFYYGLKHENKKITINQAGCLIDDYLEDGGTFNDLSVEIMSALAKSLGTPTANEDVEEIEEEEICTLKNIILIKLDKCNNYQEKEKDNND